MRYCCIHIALIGFMVLGFLLVLGLGSVHAQRINFSTWTGSDEISIQSPEGAMPSLNFNQKKPAIVAGSEPVVILISDSQAIIYEIEAPENFDLTVEIDAPTHLTFEDDPSKTIPFQLRISYNNMTPSDGQSGKLNSIELPIGYTNITFPVNRRMSGAPGPPPTPEHGGYTRVRGKAYIYLYGILGPVGTVPAGLYEGNINIHVSFTSYED